VSLADTSKTTWLWLDAFAGEHGAEHGNRDCELCDLADRLMRILPDKPTLRDIDRFQKSKPYGPKELDPYLKAPSKKAH
jgi:hypothetical protein